MGKRKSKPGASDPLGLDGFESRLGKALDRAESDPDSFDGMHAREGNPRTLAPRVPEAADIARKHRERTAAAGPAWKDGVMHPRKDPIKAAVAAKGKWEAALKKAMAEGSFVAGLEAVDEDEMVAILEATDPSVFTSGVDRRSAKYERKMAKVQPLLVALAEEIDRMPQDTEAQREARMLAAVRGMREIGKRVKKR